jgi:hypothetical protein
MFSLDELIHLMVDIVLVQYYGWVLFLAGLIYMLFWLKRDANRKQWEKTIKWVFLEVKVDELSEKSPLAMEQVFAALHAIQQNFTWGEDFAGEQVLSFSCELVSIGGRVSYIFKIPVRFRNLLESAIFAQYPKAEIHEVEDYLRNIPRHYDPATADFDFFGYQINKGKESAYPIRTYSADLSFEHGAQETFVDPMSNLLEVMSNMQPHELLAYQIVLKPVNDDWKKHTEHLLDKLKGVPSHHEEGLFEKILFFIPRIVGDALIALITPPSEEKRSPARVQEEPPTLMLHRTDVEKKVMTAIQSALGKIGYEVRMRVLYLAPKDKFNKSMRIPEVVGALRNFDDVNLNKLKPDIGHTWTAKPYYISERLERPYTQMNTLTRKRHFLDNFIPRSHWRGSHKYIMNTEELATVYHFPQVPHSRVSQLERVQGVKVAPPTDLPIG